MKQQPKYGLPRSKRASNYISNQPKETKMVKADKENMSDHFDLPPGAVSRPVIMLPKAKPTKLIPKIAFVPELPENHTGWVRFNGIRYYYYKGMLHRRTGPAVVDGNKVEFYIDGAPISFDEWRLLVDNDFGNNDIKKLERENHFLKERVNNIKNELEKTHAKEIERYKEEIKKLCEEINNKIDKTLVPVSDNDNVRFQHLEVD